jgi:hypothetical protein
MESAFGRDFSGVRIHTDERAAEASAAMNARAFTVGGDISFGAGEYQPGTMIGDALIAHELAHVAQQGGSGTGQAILQRDEPETNSLEEDADISAVKAVAPLWLARNSRLYGLGKNAMPRIRSGLKLQRCPKPKPAALPPAVNPFAPEFAPTKEQVLREAENMKQGKERFAKDPDSYDVDFVPDVTVVLKRESYCYNFRYQDVDDVCLPPDPRTAGCVMVDSPSFENLVHVQQQKQKLGTVDINSPLAVEVTSFPIAFTAYVQTDQIKEGKPLEKNPTMNEELHHIVTDFELMQTYKERLARNIRLRLVEARQQAARSPTKADDVIGQKAIERIVDDEWKVFNSALSYQRGLNTEFVHKGVDTGTLGVVTLPPAFRMPPIKVGVRGSLLGNDKDCR